MKEKIIRCRSSNGVESLISRAQMSKLFKGLVSRQVPTALGASVDRSSFVRRSLFVRRWPLKHENEKRMCMIFVLREYRIQ